MRCLPKLICIFCIFLSLSVVAQKPIELSSPNGKIIFSFKLQNKSAMYGVRFKGNTIVDYSLLHLKFDNGAFKNNLLLNKPIFKDTIEKYALVAGKVKMVTTHYKEVIIPLEESILPFRKINFVVRVFDDGLAFRYSWPKQENWDSFLLYDETTSFRLKGDPTMLALLLPSYTTSHEGLYTSLPLSMVKNDTLIDMPALFDFHNSTYLAITEAALVDYAGMYLSKHNGILESKLSPLPNQTTIKVKAVLPHQSPWRVFMLSDRVGALIESNILTSLNEPNKVHEVGWIKPGKTTFPWWNGNIVPDTLMNPGNNFETAKYYIDFCARNNIEYHSVVEYGLHQWYMDDGVNFQPGPNADVTTPVPGLDMQRIVDYATEKGVGIRVWVHWAALYPKLDSAFALFKKWGIKGMMVDFMDRDDQEMVNIQTEILQKAAAHHFHIQFHGSYKPTGLNRTYPNEFTREGTLNYEANKWSDMGLSPDHDLSIPFTRMLAGSTDYHLGGFRAVPQKFYKGQYSMPLMVGTRCHMLAMYVVLENYLQMVCDYPAAYEGQPGFEFIKKVPTTWEETKVLNAKIGEYITIARRNNSDWYIGTITNHQSRQLTIPLKFLKNGKYLAEIYSDAKDVDTMPDHLIKQIKEVTQKDTIVVTIASGGGMVMRLTKK